MKKNIHHEIAKFNFNRTLSTTIAELESISPATMDELDVLCDLKNPKIRRSYLRMHIDKLEKECI